MAKIINKLSLKDKMEQVLIPENDQPYEVPENWCWVKTGSVANFLNGRAYKQNELLGVGKTKLLRVGNLFTNNFWYYSDLVLDENKYCDTDDLIYAWSASFGPFIWYGGKVIYHYHIWKVIESDVMLKKYLYYWLLADTERLKINGHGTGMQHITKEMMENRECPLPPLSEQQRIVEQIENLFNKLDEANIIIDDILDKYQNTKSNLLHKAFIGKLVNMEYNNNEIECIFNNIEIEKNKLISAKQMQKPKKIELINDNDYVEEYPKRWGYRKLGEIAFVTKLAGFEYTKYINLQEAGEIPVIRAQNVRKGYLNLKNLMYISKEISELLPRSALTKKCILITFIGAGIGDVSILDDNRRFHLAPNVAKVELFNGEKKSVLEEYLQYYLLSDFGQYQIFKHLKATAQPSLSMETIRDIVVPIPSIDEQKIIVRVLDECLSNLELAMEKTNIKDEIEMIKKSILAKAFHGELSTTDLSDPSSIELLKTILAD